MTISEKDLSDIDFTALEVFDVNRDVPPANHMFMMKLKVDGTDYTFPGKLIGYSTSESANHRDHPTTDYAPQKVKCSACRWLEVELYIKYSQDDDAPIYVVVTRGPSMVPGETDYEKITFTESPWEIVEVLTVRKPRSAGGNFMPPQHARALAQAANVDARIKEVYLEAVA